MEQVRVSYAGSGGATGILGFDGGISGELEHLVTSATRLYKETEELR
ncbi:MAG: hypothetical protein LBR58_05030 [Propionibacteriaceae bacterium]|jgi:hypothetical protein|nr:hypothetical protein [Propionibacteriaceae bacterium]